MNNTSHTGDGGRQESFIADYSQPGQATCIFEAFNTQVTLKIYLPEGKTEDGGKAAARTCFVKVIDLCSRYENLLSRTREGTDIWKLNHADGGLVEVTSTTFEALQDGIRYSACSKGRFDITAGSVTGLWNFKEGIVPDAEDIEAALEHVNWRAVELSAVGDGADARYFARLRDPEAMVDLGGTAKGLIADKICQLLSAEGIPAAFINLGGNVAVMGAKPDGNQWKIGIQDPFTPGQIVGVLSIAQGSVVTSGLYERCFEKDGVLYHHILDLGTGYPSKTDVAGVSVFASTSAEAEGYSTTLFAMGLEAGLAFIEEIPTAAAIFVTKDKKTVASSRLAGAYVDSD